MRKQLQGISLILFGILLAVFALSGYHIPLVRSFDNFACYASIVFGVVGLILVFKDSDDNKK